MSHPFEGHFDGLDGYFFLGLPLRTWPLRSGVRSDAREACWVNASFRICSRPVLVAVPARVDDLAFEEAGFAATELGFFFAMSSFCHFSAKEDTQFLANTGVTLLRNFKTN